MIISRTPFRISFSGGGTDLADFYLNEFGAVISTAIDKYMYITVNKRFDHTIRVSYSKTEIADHVDDIHHPIVRETMKLVGITEALEIVSIADMPAQAGLGSSSSFTVGLLNALYAYKGIYASSEKLASEACRLEIEILKEPIGKQDQYIAAYGGIQKIQFNTDHSVYIDPVIFPLETKKSLNDHLMMFFTGLTRSAGSILSEQRKQTLNKINTLKQMRDYAFDIIDILVSNKDIRAIGKILHNSWLLKKEITSQISNSEIDEIYLKAIRHGALGGKILGAGGGGFLLLFVEPENKERIRKQLGHLKEIPFLFESQGSKIIYVEN